MSLQNEREVTNAKAKIARMEARQRALVTEMPNDQELREMTAESLQRTINQFREEIARYDARQPARK